MRLFFGTLGLLSILAALAPGARAESCPTPAEAEDLKACFAGPHPAYLVALSHSGFSAIGVSSSLGYACSDLERKDLQSRENIIAKAFDIFADTVAFPLVTDIPTAVADMIGPGPVLKDYENRLAEIGKIKDRYLRIRMTYELAMNAQGNYSTRLSLPVTTPALVLNRAKAGKPAGVCRDFAKLLTWSLMRVNRSPASQKGWGGLDEDSFMATIVRDLGAQHAWVEVLLPAGQGDNQVFYKMHLDTTAYDTHYSPLFQRRLGLPAAQLLAYQKECRAVQDCADKVALKHLNDKKPVPVPQAALCQAQ